MLHHTLTAKSAAAMPQTGGRVERLWAVDAARGVTVVFMVFFHFMWNLHFFGLAAVDINAAGWQSFARSIGSSFICLLGLSLALRHLRQGLTLRYLLRRAALLLGLGMVITLATYLFVGAEYVRFGILHLLGATTLLVWPFVYLRPWLSMAAGLGLIAAGWFLARLFVPFPWLIWLGVQQTGVWMVDYYPLLPWSGFALLGVGLGLVIGQRAVGWQAPSRLAHARPIKALRWLGQHSLLIYLLHQPVLIGALLAYQALSEVVF